MLNFNGHDHPRLVAVAIKVDFFDAANHHASTFDSRLFFQTADVVEHGRDVIGFLETQAEQIGRLQCQKQQRCSAYQHQQTYPDIVVRALHSVSPFK